MDNMTGNKLYAEKELSFKMWLSSGKGFIAKILILAVLLTGFFVIMYNVFEPNDVDEFSLSVLPVLLMAVYFVASKSSFMDKNYKISDNEKSIKRKMVIFTIVAALAIQAGLSLILPWYISSTGNNNILIFINLYTAVIIGINALCMLYLAYRYIKYKELSLAGALSLQFGVFATAIFAYDIMRHISDPEVIYSFIFILMPYLVSVVLYLAIEMYVKIKRR